MADQVAAEQHRRQTAESIEGSQNTLLMQGGGIAQRKLTNDDARRGILGVDPPGVRVLATFEPRGAQNHS